MRLGPCLKWAQSPNEIGPRAQMRLPPHPFLGPNEIGPWEIGWVGWGGAPHAAITIFHKTLIKVKEPGSLGLTGRGWDMKRWL